MFNTFFFFNCIIYEMCWKTATAGQVRDDNIILRMRFAYLVTKVTDTNFEGSHPIVYGELSIVLVMLRYI